MHDVREVPFRGPLKTHLWFSQKVVDEFAHFRKKGDPNGIFLKKLQRMAQNGFALHERGDWPSVKHEWSGVYRIGIHSSLFRIIGFYEYDRKDTFIAIDAFLKRGQKLSSSETGRINNVVREKNQGHWRKVSNEQFPRLAE